MSTYLFHLRSGKTVKIGLVGSMEKVLATIAQELGALADPENQWIASADFESAVRWTDVEGWEPVA
ncbi:MAG: hypothetical protein ABWY81_10950 [Jiangellaceae bacterium]